MSNRRHPSSTVWDTGYRNCVSRQGFRTTSVYQFTGTRSRHRGSSWKRRGTSCRSLRSPTGERAGGIEPSTYGLSRRPRRELESSPPRRQRGKIAPMLHARWHQGGHKEARTEQRRSSAGIRQPARSRRLHPRLRTRREAGAWKQSGLMDEAHTIRRKLAAGSHSWPTPAFASCVDGCRLRRMGPRCMPTGFGVGRPSFGDDEPKSAFTGPENRRGVAAIGVDGPCARAPRQIDRQRGPRLGAGRAMQTVEALIGAGLFDKIGCSRKTGIGPSSDTPRCRRGCVRRHCRRVLASHRNALDDG